MIGMDEIGGGGTGETAYRYLTELRVNQDKFYEAKIGFKATQIGYVSVSMFNFRDIRYKGSKLPKKYRTGTTPVGSTPGGTWDGSGGTWG